MDNVTHSLMGLAVGEAVALKTKKARLPIWIASALANNLPDTDVLLTVTAFRGRLGYLLHHRGHTHTLLLAPLLSLLLLLAIWLCTRGKKDFPWREVIFVSFLGPFLHLFADAWNSYGVHPFWPFDNRWFYGDMLFVVEPWIWVLFLPPVFFACASRWGKGICLALLALILGLSWFHPYMPVPVALLLTGASALLFLLGRKLDRGRRIFLSLWLAAVFLTGMFSLSRALKALYIEPGAEIALSPLPGNPFCWAGIEVKRQDGLYQAETFTLAAFPGIFPASRCPKAFSPPISPPLLASMRPQTLILRPGALFRAPASELDEIAKDCVGNAYLRFARIPIWKKEKSGGWLLGDLRFYRGANRGFAQIEAGAGAHPCPSAVPPWIGRFHPGEEP